MNRALGCLLIGWAFTGCAQPGEAVTTFGLSPIVGGERSSEAANAVVIVAVPATETLCTGTLISSNLVMTALHCVSHFNPFGTFSCDTQGVLITSTPPDGEIGATVDPAEVQIHVGVIPDAVPDAYGSRIVGSASEVICRNDIALVVLDRHLEAPSVPVRLTRPTTRGERMVVVGYGQTEASESVGRFQRADVAVSDVGASLTGTASGSAAPNTFVLGPGACQGDSGGPALSTETGAIVGVYSLSAGIGCTSSLIRNIYTQVAPYSALINRAIEIAETQPVLEPSNQGGADSTSSAGMAGIVSGGADGLGSAAAAAGAGGLPTSGLGNSGTQRSAQDGCSVGRSMMSARAISFSVWLLASLALGYRSRRDRD